MCEGVQISERMVLDLEAQGEEVGFFMILDTWVLQNSQKPWLWRLAYYRQRIRKLRTKSLTEKISVYRNAIMGNVSRVVDRNIRVRDDWRQAYWPENCEVRRFRAPVVLFKRPKQPFYYVDDPYLGWGARSQRGVDIHEINFRHREMLREPYVQIMGNKLASYMLRLSDAGVSRNDASVLSGSAAVSGDAR
jgi:thioesterase domain-containing protein